MKTFFAMMILFAASSSFARVDGVGCRMQDKTSDQVKLSVYFKEDYECDMAMGPYELYCSQNPDTEGMTPEAVEKLGDDLRITKCIDRAEKEVNIKTMSGRTIKTLAQLKLSDSSECEGVQMPKIANELSCRNQHIEFRPGFYGNPRIPDTGM